VGEHHQKQLTADYSKARKVFDPDLRRIASPTMTTFFTTVSASTSFPSCQRFQIAFC
jgi:hypothetical protein